MNKHDEAVQRLIEIESKLGLERINILDIPVWNIIRYKIRGFYILLETGINLDRTKSIKIDLFNSIKGYVRSFFSIIKLLCRKNKIDNLLLGFPRLEKVGDHYIDKFIDPIISTNIFEGNYLNFVYSKTGMHKSPRLYNNNLVTLDFIYLLTIILSYFLSPFILIFSYQKINKLNQQINTHFIANKNYRFFIANKIAETLFLRSFYKNIIRKLNVKRIFGVSRVLFLAAAAAAKSKGVLVYEIQHGITNGPTRLYSGTYNRYIDPDYFLTFGNFCSKKVFGIPEDKIINIGWAFKSFIHNFPIQTIYSETTVLLISESQISQKIIDVSICLASLFPKYMFHIRRHPQEEFTLTQKKTISQFTNIIDVSNSENSNIVIRSYKQILGENSSVLYEALSIGKKVGRIGFGGLTPKDTSQMKGDGFFYLRKIEDFSDFISQDNISNNKNDEIYSDFKPHIFKSIISTEPLIIN